MPRPKPGLCSHVPLVSGFLIRRFGRSGGVRLAQQLRQLGDVGGDAPGLVAGEEVSKNRNLLFVNSFSYELRYVGRLAAVHIWVVGGRGVWLLRFCRRFDRSPADRGCAGCGGMGLRRGSRCVLRNSIAMIGQRWSGAGVRLLGYPRRRASGGVSAAVRRHCSAAMASRASGCGSRCDADLR
jgi:hypothetical protein